MREAYRQIHLTKGLKAKVSVQDFELLSQFKWCASQESAKGMKFYAVRFSRKNKVRKIRMHRFILGLGHGKNKKMVVDHINGDSLDNRRENLEIVTQKENLLRAEGWNKCLRK